MRYLPLIWANLCRKPVRTIFTMSSVVIAFVLFGMLQGVDSAFTQSLHEMKLDRLFIDGRQYQPMPLAYLQRIAAVPGVTHVTQVTWLSGSYQDPKNGVYVIATQPAVWLTIRPQFHVPRQQIEAIAHMRTGAIVSEWLARKNQWKVGDKITLQTTTANNKGSTDWIFDVVGVMGNPGTTKEVRQLLANYEYYDEARTVDRGTADRYLLEIDDPLHATGVARQIDSLFANAPVQTRTQTEQEYATSTLASIGDLNFFTRSIMAAAFFTLLVLTGNTMMESVRERTPELAVLHTIGYTRRLVLLLVLVEALALCITAALVGLGIAAALFPLVQTYVATAVLPPVVLGVGGGIAVAIALLSACIPAWHAMRLSVVAALTVR